MCVGVPRPCSCTHFSRLLCSIPFPCVQPPARQWKNVQAYDASGGTKGNTRLFTFYLTRTEKKLTASVHENTKRMAQDPKRVYLLNELAITARDKYPKVGLANVLLVRVRAGVAVWVMIFTDQVAAEAFTLASMSSHPHPSGRSVPCSGFADDFIDGLG